MHYYIDYSEKPKYKFYCIENVLELLPDGWEEVDKEKYYKETIEKNKHSFEVEIEKEKENVKHEIEMKYEVEITD